MLSVALVTFSTVSTIRSEYHYLMKPWRGYSTAIPPKLQRSELWHRMKIFELMFLRQQHGIQRTRSHYSLAVLGILVIWRVGFPYLGVSGTLLRRRQWFLGSGCKNHLYLSSRWGQLYVDLLFQPPCTAYIHTNGSCLSSVGFEMPFGALIL